MWYFLFWPKTYIGGEKILKLNKSNVSWKCSEWLKVRTSTVAWWWSKLHLLTKTMKCGWKHQAGKWILSRKWLVNCCFQKNKSSRYSWRNNFKRTHFDLIWIIIWFCSINKAEKNVLVLYMYHSVRCSLQHNLLFMSNNPLIYGHATPKCVFLNPERLFCCLVVCQVSDPWLGTSAMMAKADIMYRNVLTKWNCKISHSA